jgi:hypothetical protein
VVRLEGSPRIGAAMRLKPTVDGYALAVNGGSSEDVASEVARRIREMAEARCSCRTTWRAGTRHGERREARDAQPGEGRQPLLRAQADSSQTHSPRFPFVHRSIRSALPRNPFRYLIEIDQLNFRTSGVYLGE